MLALKNDDINNSKPFLKIKPNHRKDGPFYYRPSHAGGDHGLKEWGRERIVTAQNARFKKGWMRNQPCHCGSGDKFKKCCWDK